MKINSDNNTRFDTRVAKCIVVDGGIFQIFIVNRYKLAIVCNRFFIYRDADKSLARPGRKQAQKHVRDPRDFNNIETRTVIKFFFPASQGAGGNSFLVGLRTYQHPCKYKINITLTARKLLFFIFVHSAFVLVQPNRSLSVTIQN